MAINSGFETSWKIPSQLKSEGEILVPKLFVMLSVFWETIKSLSVSRKGHQIPILLLPAL